MKVALLGPSGTHSELALREFDPGAERVFCASISGVFEKVLGGEADAGLVPIENVIQGPVTETLDLLLAHKGKIYAASATLLDIRHALGVLDSGPWPRKITQVFSHEQALRQCATRLSSLFPAASAVPYPSTTAAISLILEERKLDAAILAPEAALREKGLRVVDANLSDNPENKTRFVSIRRGDVRSEIEKSLPRPRYVIDLVIDPGRDRKGLLFEIIQILSVEHRINLNSIHSRPDNRGGFVFHLALEGHPKDPTVAAGLQALDDYCRLTTGATAEAVIVGFHEHRPFFSLPFETIGIVGGLGRMGKWFTEFFESVGIRVLHSDVDSSLSLKDLCSQCKVVLVSVPMSQAGSVAREVCSFVSAGQLLVENCSIKDCALSVLEEMAPEGVEVLGIHTMFGDKTSTLRGENVIVTRTSRSGSLSQSFESLLYKHGAHLYQCSAEEHDQVSAVVQALLQLSLLVVGDVTVSALPHRKVLKAFSTPNFRLFETAMLRVVNQVDQLTVDLQMLNPKAERVRRQLLESVCRLVFSLEHGDREILDQTVAKLRNYFEDKS